MKSLFILASLCSVGSALAVEAVESNPVAAVTTVYYCTSKVADDYRYPLKFQVVSATGTVLDSGVITNYRVWDDCVAAAKAANEATAR